MEDLNVFVFTWNTQSIPLSETNDKEVYKVNRKRFDDRIPSITGWNYTCEFPDFIDDLKSKIIQAQAHVVIVGFQEDRHPGSYFHSHLLPEELGMINFTLLKRTKLMGLGITSYKGVKSGDPFYRGLRTSIYVRNDRYEGIKKEDLKLSTHIGNNGQEEFLFSNHLVRGKGATCSYMDIPGKGRLAVINCHFPFVSKSLVEEKKNPGFKIRQKQVNIMNNHFNDMVNTFVNLKIPKPDYVIMFGDFNYRVIYDDAWEVTQCYMENPFIHNLYYNHDELYAEMDKDNIFSFKEGVYNMGITFPPTCKIRWVKDKNGDDMQQWNIGKLGQRVPSWCDRILYDSTTDSIRCTNYSDYTFGAVIKQSDHCGVIAELVL